MSVCWSCVCKISHARGLTCLARTWLRCVAAQQHQKAQLEQASWRFVCHHNLRHTRTRAHKRHRQATCKGNLFVTSIHRNVCMCAGPAAWPTAEKCCCGHEEQQRIWQWLEVFVRARTHSSEHTIPSTLHDACAHPLDSAPSTPSHTQRGAEGWMLQC